MSFISECLQKFETYGVVQPTVIIVAVVMKAIPDVPTELAIVKSAINENMPTITYEEVLEKIRKFVVENKIQNKRTRSVRKPRQIYWCWVLRSKQEQHFQQPEPKSTRWTRPA